MQGIGMLIKPHYIKDYTMQNHPGQGPTVYRDVTPSVAQVAHATPIISEFSIVIWSKFNFRKMTFTLGNTNIFLEFTPLYIYIRYYF